MLFVLKAWHKDGTSKAFLYDDDLSAFPGEQEYLVAALRWRVDGIEPDQT